jgi:plastocyanin
LRRNIAATAVALGALVVAPVAVSQAVGAKTVKKTVKIGDNFFSPDSLKVPKNTKVTWRWPTNPGDVHDVYLRKGPKGVKKFHSDLAASGYSFARTLKKPGTYSVICTLHRSEMKMTIRVKR